MIHERQYPRKGRKTLVNKIILLYPYIVYSHLLVIRLYSDSKLPSVPYIPFLLLHSCARFPCVRTGAFLNTTPATIFSPSFSASERKPRKEIHTTPAFIASNLAPLWARFWSFSARQGVKLRSVWPH